jgi:hypothetical protein
VRCRRKIEEGREDGTANENSMVEMTAPEVAGPAAAKAFSVSRTVDAGPNKVPAVTWPTCVGDASETDPQQRHQENGCCAALTHRVLRSGRRLDR